MRSNGMSGGIFQFKEFTMKQSLSGQRINTDSCAFADIVQGNAPLRILDIGCGTGVLALMMSQKFPTATIRAVEIDAGDAGIAAENFAACPWQDRLLMLNLSVQDFAQETTAKFDLIVTNPPFFNASTKSLDPARALARHDDQLPASDLVTVISKLLLPDGVAWLLCAAEEEMRWLDAFKRQNLSVMQRTGLADNPEAAPHGFVLGFSKKENRVVTEQRVNYRDTPGGGRSEWMAQHRARWFPF